MWTIRRGIVVSVIALSLALGTTSAFAMDNGTGGAGKTQKDLEGDGYTCTVVATGFTECTKSGSTTYWCDASGACEPKPFRTTTTGTFRRPTGTAVYSQP
jgi:hypothetical protein